MDDKISIIVTVYNLEAYIARAIQSLLNQSYQNIEIIVVDDGSSDSSWAVVSEIANTDFRIIPVHQNNMGVMHARNTGIVYSSGDWIGFMDGDDTVDEDMYEFLLQNAHKYNAEISHCGYKAIFESGKIEYHHNSGVIIEQDTKNAIIDLLEGNLVEPSLCNKLFKREVVNSILGLKIDYSIKNYEDLLINFLLFTNCQKAIFVDLPKYNYVNRSDSASKNKNEQAYLDVIKVKETILSLSSGEIILYAKKSYLFTCVNSYSAILRINKKSTNLKFIRQKIKELKRYYSLVDNKLRIRAYLINYCPVLYKSIYFFYSHLLRN